jgi:hypothetical protein
MGNNFFNSNLGIEGEKEEDKENEKYFINEQLENNNNKNEGSNIYIKINPPKSKKKPKYNFYLNQSFYILRN